MSDKSNEIKGQISNEIEGQNTGDDTSVSSNSHSDSTDMGNSSFTLDIDNTDRDGE